MKKRSITAILMLICSISLCACNKKEEMTDASVSESEESAENVDEIQKGYDLLVSAEEKEEAERDCKRQIERIADLYKKAERNNSSEVVFSEDTLVQMQDAIAEDGSSVRISEKYSNMRNCEKVDDFLNSSTLGKSGFVVIYSIHSDGVVVRNKYSFDGKDMYVLTTSMTWNDMGEIGAFYSTYTRIREWRYSKLGWFCYELCVPQYPEVTEVINGSCLVRVKPISEKNQELSKKYVGGLGYKGNNLLCSNWNADHMEDLDFNGMYEYLYAVKYQKKFDSEKYQNGIPKEEFENLIMEYLPITAEEIQTYAAFDKVSQIYAWEKSGCGNYDPTYFGTSLPEVTAAEEKEDGIITLTVHAVCEMLCDDSALTHKLTIKVNEDGSFQYLGNEISDDEISKIPDYQYRIEK